MRSISRASVALLVSLSGALAIWGCGGEEEAQLLLVSYSAPDGPGVYSVSADGSELARLGTFEADGLAVPSPDGRLVASPCRADGDESLAQTDVCLSRIDDSESWIATEGKLPPLSFVGSEMAWSPDSRLLAFVVGLTTEEGTTIAEEVYSLDPGTNEVRQLPAEAPVTVRTRPRWSPDGRRLAVLTTTRLDVRTSLEVVDLEDGTSLNLTEEMEGRGVIDDFAWAPGGSALAFVRNTMPAGSVEMYVATADGGGLRQLSIPTGFFPISAGTVWSPDGEWLAVPAAPDEGGFARTFILPADGGEPAPLAPDLTLTDSPTWSPDGRRLAFVGAEGEPDARRFRASLYVMDIPDGAPRQLAQHEHLLPFPLITWSPDGRRLFYTAEGGPCIEGCPPGFLFVVPADGSALPVQLTDFRVNTFLGWQP